MPFPLAHPAAVLPLRRWSHHYLNFVGLLIGSITPDLSYCLEKYKMDDLAHSIGGCFIFSLPVGWVLWLIFLSISEPLVSLLPAPHRQALLPACRRPDQPWFAVPLSLLIGAGTHVLWDSFTHDTGWFVERSSFLQSILFSLDGHSFHMYRLLWHISTWVGLFLLYRVYTSLVRRSTASGQVFSMEEKHRYAQCAWLLLLPLVVAVSIAFLHDARDLSSVTAVPHFLRLSAALYLLELSVLLVGLGAVLRVTRRSTG